MRNPARLLALATVVAGVVAMPAVTFSAALRAAPRTEHGYVASKLGLPTNDLEAKTFGRDIDGDGHSDNAFGKLLAALASTGVDVTGATQSAVTDGDLLMLGSLRVRSFAKDTKATWQVLYAKAAASPDFSGAGSFPVDAGAPHSARLAARVRKHHVTTAAGTIPLEVDLGAGVVTLHLKDAEISATCGPAGCSKGRVTGVIMHAEVVSVVAPQLATMLTALIARDCPGPDPSSCAGGSTGATVQSIFDMNDDLVVTADELLQSALIQALLASDIDTNHDNVKDGISAGVGFEAVKARIKH